ncbi:MAG: PAS domain S-box protein [Spirochaetia bacterium]
MPKRILLVEDEPSITTDKAETLQNHGFSVVTATTKEKALTLLTTEPEISLLLIDISLGKGSDGTELAEGILRTYDIPIVFLTTPSDKKYIENAKKSTNYGCVVKNSDEHVLVETIHMAYKLFQAKKDLKIANAKRRESEEKLAAIYEHISTGIAQVSLDFHIEAANEAYCTMLGYTEDELKGKHLREITHPEVIDKNLEKQRQLVEGIIDHYQMEKKFIHKSGRTIYGILNADLIRDSSGAPLYCIGSVLDISYRIQAEQELQGKEEKFRTLVDQSVDMMFLHDLNGKIVDVNKTGVELLGYTREELLSMSIPDLDPYYPQREDQGRFWRQIDMDTPYRFEAELRRKDGFLLPVEIALSKVFVEGETYIMTLSRDISERKQAIEALNYERIFLSTVLDNVEEAIVICDAQGRIIRFNEAAKRLHGVVAPLTPAEQWSEQYKLYRTDGTTPLPTHEIPLYRALKGEDVYDAEIVVVPKGGTPHNLMCNGHQLHDAGGKIIGAVIAMHDVTDYKRVVKNLNTALSEKEYLMRELNHRVKNNLAMVSSLISLKDAEIESDLSDLRAQIDTIQKIYEQLHQAHNLESINFKGYFRDLLDHIFATCVERRVSIEVNSEDIRLSPKTTIPLGLLINELATNAMKHGFNDTEKAIFRVEMEKNEPNNHYILRISNSGNPFPEETGLDNPHTLGLQLVSTLVAQLQGSIELKRKPSPVFTIKFPIGGR